MSKKTSLKAAPRLRTGSGPLNQMRREGLLPAVIYGKGTANINLKIDAKTFNDVLSHSSSENIIVNLEIEGHGTRLAFLQSVQHNPLSGIVVHVDFRAIDEKTAITAHIPTHLNGESAGVKAGGLIEQYVHAIEITCLPNDLPETLEVDVSHLQVGDSLHIGDITFPAGVRATHAAEVVVAHVGKPASAVSEEASAVPSK